MDTIQKIQYCTACLLLCFLFLTHISLSAQTVSWDNGGDKINWSDPLNWSSDVLPVAGDTVIINGETVMLVGISPVPRIARLVLIKANLTVNQELQIENADTSGICLRQESVLINDGRIVFKVAAAAISILEGSQFYNDSEVEINGGTAGIYTEEDTYLQNDGSIHIRDCLGIGIQNVGDFENDGLIDIIVLSDYGMRCAGGLQNKNDGKIHIASISGFRGLYCDTLGHVSNHGLMRFHKAAIRVLGEFNNFDTVAIDSAGGMQIGSSLDTINIAKFHNFPGSYYSAGNSFGQGAFINYPDTLINQGKFIAYDQYCGGIFSRGHFENYDTVLCNQIMTCGGIVIEHTGINHATGFISVTDSPSFGTGLRIQSGHFDNYGEMYLEELDRPISNSGQLHIHAIGKITVSQMSPGDYLLDHYTYSDNYLIVDGELDIK